MRPGKLARTLLRLLAALAAAAAFVVLDWYPTVRELGQLRRERGDLESKVKDYAVRDSKFVFPDEAERGYFVQGREGLERALPESDDASWLERALSGLRRQAAADGIARTRLLISPGPGLPVEPGAQAGDWLAGQLPDVREGLEAASAPGRYFWSGIYPGPGSGGEPRLAGRPLAVALTAPLPALLNFINHSTWGEIRLEIVRLRLVACAPMPRCWLVLRGYYLGRGPSPWKVPGGAGGDDGLLVDPDSPLLWQKAAPPMVPLALRRELSASSSRGAE